MSVEQESTSWQQLVSFENLYIAWTKARKGKSGSSAVANFAMDLEQELFGLSRRLSDGSWQPGGYRTFTIYERKPRLIAAAPFRDRVVHHALMNVVEPLFERAFIVDSYACRKGKGGHAAVDRYQQWSRGCRYALKIDIKAYFPTVDHGILKRKLRFFLGDAMILDLLDKIIDSARVLNTDVAPRGLPIGNLTSQYFANVYLNDLDHWVTGELGIHAYLRYVDDMILLSDSRRQLHEARRAISERLLQEQLSLHERKWQLVPVRAGLDVLGYRVWPRRRRIRNDNVWRFSRRLRKMAQRYAEGKSDWAEIDASVQSWLGHARHADCWRLRQDIFRGVIFRRVQNTS